MSRNAFVVPETVKLELSEGDWIEVKRELTYGELLEWQDESNVRDETDKVHFVLKDFYLTRMLLWLVDWSLEDAKGPVEITEDAIRALRGPIALEINTALDKHINEVEAKNLPTPESIG